MSLTYKQFLLTKLAEECAEVAQRCSKQIQFGADEVQTGQEFSNRERLADELGDLLVKCKLLQEVGELPKVLNPTPEQEAAKRRKLEKYHVYARTLGNVE